VLKGNLDGRLETLTQAPEDTAFLARTADVAELLQVLGLEVNLWKTQNLYFHMLQCLAPCRREKAAQGDTAAQEWMGHFKRLGEQLGFKVEG
jgi:hypothetical protein